MFTPAYRVSALTVAACVALAAGCRPTSSEQASHSPAPIVQPGAPGQPSRDIAAGSARPASAPAVAADTQFMLDMIHHHAQAVEMVNLLKTRTRRDDMRRLGERIAVSQNDEIAMMQTWLADRGIQAPMAHDHGTMLMPGMLTTDEMRTLERSSGPAFDRLFLTGMIRHHEGALAMVARLQQLPGAAQESTMFDFVTHVDADQRMEIGRMRQMLGAMR